METTVLKRRSSSGKTTLYDNLMDLFGCSSLNLLRCSASTWGNFFTRILQCQQQTFTQSTASFIGYLYSFWHYIQLIQNLN